MRLTQLRQADMNLLVVFTVLAEERNVSRAARRLLLSQPAVTRALGRLRDMFKDDLLVRVSGSYELTPKGRLLLQELEATLPRIDRLLTGGAFLPSQETMHFKLAGTDYASHMIVLPLAKYLLAAGDELSFELSPLNDDTLDDLNRGRLDLLFNPDDGQVSPRYERQALFQDEFVCVVDKGSPHRTKLTLDEYLEAKHISVSIFNGLQTLPDQRLAASGLKRQIAFTVPYFTVALQGVVGTNLIATVPRRLGLLKRQNSGVKLVKTPKPLSSFTYFMWWHPRMTSDAAHTWLRGAVQKAVGAL